MHLPLRISDVRTQLVQTILLRFALPKQFVLSILALLHLRLRCVPGVICFLALGKGLFDASYETNIFIYSNAECQYILLRLTFV